MTDTERKSAVTPRQSSKRKKRRKKESIYEINIQFLETGSVQIRSMNCRCQNKEFTEIWEVC